MAAHGIVHRTQLLVTQLLLERRHASVAEPLGEAPPGPGPVVQLAHVEEDAGLVGVQADVEAPFPDLGDGSQVLERGALLADRDPAVVPRPVGETQAIGERARLDRPVPSSSLTAKGTEFRTQPDVSPYRL